MKPKTLIIALSFALAALSASAQVYHYKLTFSGFSELKVVDGINVDYIADSSRAGEVEFDAESQVASAVIFEPSKSRLVVKLASRDSIYSQLPTIKVYSTFLNRVTNEGDSLLRILSVAPTAQFSAKVIGNGRISVHNIQATKVDANILSGHGLISMYGKCTDAILKVTGSGQIQVDELPAKYVKASITGTGMINCYAESMLSVSGLGSGKLYYRGNPEIKKGLISKIKLFPVE